MGIAMSIAIFMEMAPQERNYLLRTGIALTAGSIIAWVVATYSDKADFELRDTLPALCATSLAIAWHHRLRDPSQGIILAFVAGVSVALFSAVGEASLTRLPFRVPLVCFVFLPDFFNVFLFLLVCTYINLKPGIVPLLVGAGIAGVLRVIFWQVNVHSPMGSGLPMGLPAWSWLAGVAIALLLWGQRSSESEVRD